MFPRPSVPAANPLTKFPLSITPPGFASPLTPTHQLANYGRGFGGILMYSAVGSVGHAPAVQLTPLSSRINFGGITTNTNMAIRNNR